MVRPLQAVVHLDAFAANIAQVRKRCPDSSICAVIKANAYGHGAVEVARYLQRQSLVNGLAVCSVGEALELRQAEIHLPIVLLEGIFHKDEIPLAREYNLSLVVHNRWQSEQLAASWKTTDPPLWIKLNSGMNRLGLQPDDFADTVEKFASCSLMLISHYASADSNADFTEQQYNFFCAHANTLKYPQSLGNSAAVLFHADKVGDIVRPGIMLYGALPDIGNPFATGLQPAMQLNSQLIAVQELRAGEYAGYGNAWQAEQDCRIGIVACGYADGYPREISSDAYAVINARRYPLVGRVSMDMLAVLLDEHTQVGAKVQLWGDNPTVNQIAQWSKTIPYAVLTGVQTRVTRLYR